MRPRGESLLGVRGVGDGGENLPLIGPGRISYPVAPSKTYADQSDPDTSLPPVPVPPARPDGPPLSAQYNLTPHVPVRG